MKEYYSQQPIDFQPPTLSNLNEIPNEILDLIHESILLNPNFSRFLYQIVTDDSNPNKSEKTTKESIEKQQTLIWNNEIHRQLNGEKLTELAGFSGKRPALRAFSRNIPTWSPLFLDWEIDYYPNGNMKIDNWKLEGFNYQFDENKNEFNPNKKLTLSGRSLLSTQTSKILQTNLKEFQKTLSEENEQLIIEDVINIIGKFDIVTQQLSGFNEMLLGLDINDIVPISEDNSYLKKAVNGGILGLPMDTTTTYPLRSGFLVPKTIRITDDFGLAMYPFDDRNQKIPKVLKAEGIGHSAVDETNIMILSPRIVQPSRITINWIGNKSQKPIAVANDDNPIIGWIMNDYLDKSIEVFAPNGRNIGELITFKRGQKGEVRWISTDGKALPNKALNDFVNKLLTYKNAAAALSALQRSIDDGLILNSPKGINDDAFAMLFGRPLALVRATITLEVKGNISEQLKNLEFPIKIGEQSFADNGIIGYYKNMNFRELYVLNDKKLSDYLQPITTEKIQINKPLEVVLLMDTNGSAQVISGILPVFEVMIPSKYTNSAIQNMAVSFRVGPVINDPNQLNLPKPASEHRKITWQRNQNSVEVETQTATQDAHFPKGRNVLSEGRLNVKK